MNYLRLEDDRYFFSFVCVGCGSEGELGIPTGDVRHRIACPEGCGAVYVMWFPDGKNPSLKCVVQPVRE